MLTQSTFFSRRTRKNDAGVTGKHIRKQSLKGLVESHKTLTQTGLQNWEVGLELLSVGIYFHFLVKASKASFIDWFEEKEGEKCQVVVPLIYAIIG